MYHDNTDNHPWYICSYNVCGDLSCWLAGSWLLTVLSRSYKFCDDLSCWLAGSWLLTVLSWYICSYNVCGDLSCWLAGSWLLTVLSWYICSYNFCGDLSCWRRYCLTTIDNYYSKLSISHAEITKSNIIRCNLVENGYSDNICIGKLNIFLNLTEWYFQCQRIDPDNGKYWSVWRHIVTFNTDKKNNTVLKVSTCIITSITARPVGLDAILATMSVSTCKAVGNRM
jgi:hypothetical protein